MSHANKVAAATVDDHLRSMLSLMKRGATVSLSGIPNDPTFLSSHIGGDTAQAISEKIERLLALSASPSDAERHERAVPVAWTWELGICREATGQVYRWEPHIGFNHPEIKGPVFAIANIRPLYTAPPYAPSSLRRRTMPISEEMRQAFYSKAEIQKTGAIRYLDEALEAAISASPSDAERHESAVPGEPKLYGPYGYLNGNRALSEDEWSLDNDPIENNDEYFSIPLFAKVDVSYPVSVAPPPPAAVQEPVAVKVILDQVAEMLRVYELDHAHVLNDELANLMAIARAAVAPPKEPTDG